MGKYVQHDGETAKIGFCTSLKSVIYFRFVPETIAFWAACKIWWKSVKNWRRNRSTTDRWTDTHTHGQKPKWLDSLSKLHLTEWVTTLVSWSFDCNVLLWRHPYLFRRYTVWRSLGWCSLKLRLLFRKSLVKGCKLEAEVTWWGKASHFKQFLAI